MAATPPIYVVSGGVGTSGMQLTRTALAQFPNGDVSVIVVPHVRSEEQLEQIVEQAASRQGIVVHTLVDTVLRSQLIDLARHNHIAAIDLIGPLLQRLSGLLGRQPLGQPGLYRKLREQDLRRIEAIEFAVEHDDGKRAHELLSAEIVLTGVSRVGKTPLSIYLATMGWKVANVPLVKDLNPPSELFEMDSRCVIGLTIEPGQLITYRQRRTHHMGVSANLPYADPTELLEELDYAHQIFRRGRFRVVDTTNKPIEESADEIIGQLGRRLSYRPV